MKYSRFRTPVVAMAGLCVLLAAASAHTEPRLGRSGAQGTSVSVRQRTVASQPVRAMARTLTRQMLETSARQLRKAIRSGADSAEAAELAKKLDYLEAVPLNPPITIVTSGRDGVYPAEEPLLLEVTATDSGWMLGMAATDLKGDKGQKIPAKAVCWEREPGVYEDLKNPTKFVWDGEIGTTVYEVPIVLKPTEEIPLGRYEGELWIRQFPARGDVKPVRVPIVIDVQYRFLHEYEGTQMYFHFADLPAAQKASVYGTVEADAGVHLTLSVDSGSVDKLPLQKPFGDPDHPFDGPIDLDWQLSEAGGELFRGPDSVQYSGREVAWRLHGTPGTTAYELECTVAPEGYQAPGDYGTEITISIQPLL